SHFHGVVAGPPGSASPNDPLGAPRHGPAGYSHIVAASTRAPQSASSRPAKRTLASNQSALSQSRLSPVQPRFHSRNGGSSPAPRRRLRRGTQRDRYRRPVPLDSDLGSS